MSLPNDTATRIARIVTADVKRFRDANPQGIYATGRLAECIRAALLAEGDGPRAKPRDVIFDALAKASGFDLGMITRPAAGRIAKAKADILAVSPNVTPEQIEFVAKQLAKKYTGAPVTPTSISGHWAEFRTAPVEKPKASAPKGWLTELRSMYPTSVYFVAGGEFEIKGESEHAWTQLPASVRMAIEKELSR